MNKYAELRQRQQQEVNALPIGFAFGNRQFEEMMRGWGLDPEKDLDKIYRLGRTGGYYKKTDAQLIHDTFSRHDAELQAAIAEDKTGEGFIYETTTSTATRWTRRRRWTRWGTRQTRCWPTRASRGALRKPSRRFAGGGDAVQVFAPCTGQLRTAFQAIVGLQRLQGGTNMSETTQKTDTVRSERKTGTVTSI